MTLGSPPTEGIAEPRLLRFSLGPVGGFIGEARRTRDYWAGSFLLSWLSAVAIVEANAAGARILSPIRLEPGAVRSGALNDAPPLLRAVALGSSAATEYEPGLPNQFRAVTGAGFDPMYLRRAIIAKWRALSEAVWTTFVEPAIAHDPAQTSRTRAIWEDQIGDETACFWETLWVMGPADDAASRPDDAWMAARKRWRAPFYLGDVGEGDRCAVATDFREISGWRRSLNEEREVQRAFWAAIERHLSRWDTGRQGEGRSLDLRASERLSAPALVKRLFPRLPASTLADPSLFGWSPPSRALWAQRLFGDLADQRGADINVRYWPSTAAVAAAPWLARVMEKADAGRIEMFASRARDVSYKLSVAERQSRLWEPVLYGGSDRATLRRSAEHAASLLAADGKLFFADELSPERLFAEEIARRADAAPNDQERRRMALLSEALGTLERAAGTSPSKYYALVQLDGDRIGEELSFAAEAVTEGLARFQARVPAVFDGLPRGDGEPVRRRGDILYASADELLAITPVEDALDVAARLRGAFGAAMAETFGSDPMPTISTSVVFARYTVPLGWVVRESHALLRRAKRLDRDALGVAVLRSGGLGARWLGTSELPSPRRAAQLLATTASAAFADLARDETRAGSGSWGSNRFVYRLDSMLRFACGAEPRHVDVDDVAEVVRGVTWELFGDGPATEKLARRADTVAALVTPATPDLDLANGLAALRLIGFLGREMMAAVGGAD